MPVSIPQAGAATPDSLSELAEKYGALPTHYLSFLEKHDGAKPASNVFENDEGISVRQFLPAAEVIAKAGSIDGFSESLIPIAFDDCGNYLCIGALDHKIYFWDHEIDDDKVIASSFDQFLERLIPFDPSKMELEPKVLSVWMNPKFKPKF